MTPPPALNPNAVATLRRWSVAKLLAAATGRRAQTPRTPRARRGGCLTLTTEPRVPASGPIVFAYDGSELAKLTIDEAGRQLPPGRDALVLTVWQPFDIRFVPATGLQFDAAQIDDVKKAAEQTAAEGASPAEAAGFRARSAAIEASPSWKAIVDLADDRDASLVVLGSHGRTGVADLLLGSVAGAVAAHSRRSVLITHPISHAVELGGERIYVLATDDPVTRAVPLPPRGALDAAVQAFTLLVGARLQSDLARYATALELIVLPAVTPDRIQPTEFDHASRLIGQALTAARAVLDAAPVVESVAA